MPPGSTSVTSTYLLQQHDSKPWLLTSAVGFSMHLFVAFGTQRFLVDQKRFSVWIVYGGFEDDRGRTTGEEGGLFANSYYIPRMGPGHQAGRVYCHRPMRELEIYCSHGGQLRA
jgi:hypothetical protein